MRTSLAAAACALALFAAVSVAFAFPAGFIENRGQTDAEVLYYASGSRSAIYLVEDGIVFDLRAGAAPIDVEELVGAFGSEASAVRGAAVRIRFADAGPSMRVEARGELLARSHFFLGGDPSAWRTDVPSFEEIVYREVRPGTDLAIRFENGELVYEILSSGAAPYEAVSFIYEGTERIEREGDAVRIVTEAGTIEDTRPANGKGPGRLAVLGASGANRAKAGSAPKTRDDPARLLYGTFLGGSYIDWGYDVALNESGEMVVCGYTQSSNYPTTLGAYDVSLGGSQDAVISKLSADGSALLWSTYLGGSSNEYAFSLKLDSEGRPVVTGCTSSTDFPTTAGAYDRTHNGSNDLFVTKLSSAGNALVWSTYVGGSSSERALRVVLDAAENAVLTGETGSSNYPTTPGAYDTTPNGAADVFVTKVASAGNALVWSTVLGGSSSEYGWEVRLDSSEDVVVSGYATASSFPTTPGAYDVTYNGGDRDVFAAKFSSDGSALLWSTFLGGSDWDWSYALDLDAAGNPVLAGGTRSANFPTTPGAYDQTLGAGYDVFVSKLASAGNALLWSTFLGGDAGTEEAYAVAIDPFGNPVLTGLTSSSDFPTTPDAFDGSYNGNNDLFVSKLSSAGSSLMWSTFAGGAAQERGWSLVLDPYGNPVVAGHTESSGFPTTAGAYDVSHNGSWDAFVVRFDTIDPTGVTNESGSSIALRLAGPNPFTQETSIRYVLSREERVDVRVFDPAGRAVATLQRGPAPAGVHDLAWSGLDDSGRPVPSGVYFLRFRAGERTESRRIVFLR
jgi:hypothetical protein